VNWLDKTRKCSLDFIIAGAEKAGTSYISTVLCSSEQIVMPAHEVRYFRDPFYPNQEKLDDLLANKNEAKVGIKHPSYLGKPEVPKRIHQHNRDMKLLFILRDPVERAISSYLHYTRRGQVPLLHPNDGLPALEAGRDKHPKYRDILEFGLYYKYLSMYLELFKAEQILVLEYEQFFNGRVDMTPVTEFLKIAPITNVPESRINEGTRDWKSCEIDFICALAFNKYDDGLNIVGRNEQPYLDSFVQHLPAIRQAIGPAPIAINEDARQTLQSYYASDLAALKASGIIKPINW